MAAPMPAKNMASRIKTVIAVNTTSDVPLIMGMLLWRRWCKAAPRPPKADFRLRGPPRHPQMGDLSMGDLSLAQIG
jgi:hypothetical protein